MNSEATIRLELKLDLILVITQIDESETEQTDPDAPDGYNEAELEDMMNEDNNDDQWKSL